MLKHIRPLTGWASPAARLDRQIAAQIAYGPSRYGHRPIFEPAQHHEAASNAGRGRWHVRIDQSGDQVMTSSLVATTASIYTRTPMPFAVSSHRNIADFQLYKSPALRKLLRIRSHSCRTAAGSVGSLLSTRCQQYINKAGDIALLLLRKHEAWWARALPHEINSSSGSMIHHITLLHAPSCTHALLGYLRLHTCFTCGLRYGKPLPQQDVPIPHTDCCCTLCCIVLIAGRLGHAGPDSRPS
jgi:hypothetical protein